MKKFILTRQKERESEGWCIVNDEHFQHLHNKILHDIESDGVVFLPIDNSSSWMFGTKEEVYNTFTVRVLTDSEEAHIKDMFMASKGGINFTMFDSSFTPLEDSSKTWLDDPNAPWNWKTQ